jgi:flagellar biosynthesis/type III secretory pathway M-ring protein FliF/YscJ
VGYEASVKLTPKDTCVYSIFRNAYVWQKGEVPIKPLSILILVFMIFMVVMFIWFVLVKFRMKRANYELEALTSEGHKHLVEEDDGSDAYKGEAGHEK